MKPRNGAVVGLLFLATCSEELGDQSYTNMEPRAKAIGAIPPTEVAVWQKVSASNLPDGRYLQAAAFDEDRQVFVTFGGMTVDMSMGSYVANDETWEWNSKTGEWTNRTGTGTAPEARSGASMVFDSARGKFILFGGRAGSGFDLEDTWEWDPASAVWTNVTASGGHPSARSQHGMLYEKGTGKILLFGGGRSDREDPTGIYVTASLGDTWEYDPVTSTWQALTPDSAPTVRHDFGLVWDSTRSKAMLFGGMQTEIPGAAGTPKQDTWEWDPATSAWTERTTAGPKPSQRYAHAMAFDGKRGKVLLFGGLDMSTGGALNDLWEMDPTTFVWTRRLTGSESGVPSARLYASFGYDASRGMLELVAGITASPYGSTVPIRVPISIGPGYGWMPSREVWELDPVQLAFTERSVVLDVPGSRFAQAMAYSPATERTYLFGGCDYWTGRPFGDLWEWDGKAWTMVATDNGPSPRCGAGLTYDPARGSLILFGGGHFDVMVTYNDTWELGSNNQWTQLKPPQSPDRLIAPGMVTDTTRGKILLFGGMHSYDVIGPGGPYYDSMSDEVWEWDGKAVSWTNRTPPSTTGKPAGRALPLLTYDEGRQKLFLYDSLNYGMYYTGYSEWDPVTAGWVSYNLAEELGASDNYYTAVAYDSFRRRQVLVLGAANSSLGRSRTTEIDTKSRTVYLRAPEPSPNGGHGSSMVFDRARGVVVLYGGLSRDGYTPLSETWEYKVTNLGNGVGCTAAFASSCASGFCVEGVCCDVAACTGACKSCSVAGSEGTCVLAAAGTEVPGSCAEGKSCDGTGACKTKNGQTCATAADCASGYCVDGVCCDSACAGPCMSCHQTGRAGKCTAHAAGTDPQGECGKGTGLCKSSCDGVGACAFPNSRMICGDCLLCDGAGDCSVQDYLSCPFGGSGGYAGGFGGRPYPTGGTGGYVPNVGGRPDGGGGRLPNVGGSGGSLPGLGGRGGSIPVAGGGAGGIFVLGGAVGGIPLTGGSRGSTPRSDGAAGSIPGYGGHVAGLGGGLGGRDGAASDAGSPRLHKSGCACHIGARGGAGSGLTLPFLLAGTAWAILRKRRRPRPADVETSSRGR